MFSGFKKLSCQRAFACDSIAQGIVLALGTGFGTQNLGIPSLRRVPSILIRARAALFVSTRRDARRPVRLRVNPERAVSRMVAQILVVSARSSRVLMRKQWVPFL